MRWVFLLIGFAAGLGVGFSVSTPKAPRSGRRGAAAHSGSVGVRPDTAVPAPARSAVRKRNIEIVAPSGEAVEEDLEEGWGRVVVDFTGSGLEPEASLRGRTMSGNPKDIEGFGDQHGPQVEFDVPAGTYPVWWRDHEGRRVGVTVSVAPGRVTVVRPDQGRVLPLDDGLGGVMITVYGVDGTRAGDTPVELMGSAFLLEIVEGLTNSAGRVRFELVPGPYEFTVGSRSGKVVVKRGEWTRLDVRYTDEGELVLRGAPDGVGLMIVTPGGSLLAGGLVFRFLEPGEYRVRAHVQENGPDRRELGPVLVEAGRRTVFERGLPTGELRVRAWAESWGSEGPQVTLDAPGNMVAKRLSKRASMVVVSGRPPTRYYEAKFICLPPGRYAVELGGKEYRPVRSEAIVGGGETILDIDLEAK